MESGGLIGTLGLNGKLFLAQLINFSIVLFVLWRWVFRPVAGALEARRQKIEASVKQASDLEARMREFEREREEKMRKAQTEALEIIQRSQNQAAKNKEEIVAAAKAEAEKVLLTARAQIETDRQQLIRETREQVATLTVMVAEKILREKLDKPKDREIISEALKAVSSK